MPLLVLGSTLYASGSCSADFSRLLTTIHGLVQAGEQPRLVLEGECCNVHEGVAFYRMVRYSGWIIETECHYHMRGATLLWFLAGTTRTMAPDATYRNPNAEGTIDAFEQITLRRIADDHLERTRLLSDNDVSLLIIGRQSRTLPGNVMLQNGLATGLFPGATATLCASAVASPAPSRPSSAVSSPVISRSASAPTVGLVSAALERFVANV